MYKKKLKKEEKKEGYYVELASVLYGTTDS